MGRLELDDLRHNSSDTLLIVRKGYTSQAASNEIIQWA